MHPAQVLINLHRAKHAGATNPFNTSGEFCEYANHSCDGCPASDGTCRYVNALDLINGWSDNLYSYCGDLLDYTYEELLEAFPEYQI